MAATAIDADRTVAGEEAAPGWLRAAPLLFLLLWSGGFPVGKAGLRDAGPMTFLSLRYLLVVLVMLPFLVALRPPLPKPGEWRHLIAIGVLVQGAYFGLAYAALTFGVSAGLAALIVALQPVLVALLAPALAGERIAARAWLGLLLGLAGAAVVVLARSGVGAASPLGVAATFGSLVAMTAGTFYEKRFGVAQHPVPANIVQHGVALVAFLPVAWFGEGFAARPTPGLAAALAYLVVGNSVVAVGLLLAMVRRGRVARVSALFFLVPPLAAVMAWLLLGEAMPPLAWVGFALAAVGVALAADVLPGLPGRPKPSP
jgi:drug/metabolite transporter (DMT)-like permease